MEKSFLAWSAVMFDVLRGRSKDSRVACKGGLCFNPSSWVARLARAPSFHVNRPLINSAGTLHFANLIVWSFLTKGRGFSVVISTALQGAALGVVGECLIVSSNGI